jgi:phenolic acid decarboxylase
MPGHRLQKTAVILLSFLGCYIFISKFSNAYQVLYYISIAGTIDYDFHQYLTTGLFPNEEFEEIFEEGDRAPDYYDF